jgi:hypothetical protein
VKFIILSNKLFGVIPFKEEQFIKEFSNFFLMKVDSLLAR